MNKTIALDFDGVLHNYKGWNGGTLGQPKKGAVKGFAKLLESGYNVVIFTCRTDHEAIRQWLYEHFEFAYGYAPLVTSVKPKAIAYVDDRAIRFTNWNDIRKYFC